MEFEILPGEIEVEDKINPVIWLGQLEKWQVEILSAVLILGPVFIFSTDYPLQAIGWIVAGFYFTALNKINFLVDNARRRF